MNLTKDKVHCGVDLIDLFRDSDEITGCQGNQLWAITAHDTLNPEPSTADDFLDSLLDGSHSSLATASPLLSPRTTAMDSNEDPPKDPTDPLMRSPAEHQPPPGKKTPYVSIGLEWDSGDLPEQFGIAYYLASKQASPKSSTQTLTVKDLLLSNLGQQAQQIPQNSPQELVLNEDEKKLLAKEGVKLPSRLPLSKFEEKVLKKIRRKIRNKRSAQESRKNRREYVDSLEGRMAACSANNFLLQRRIQELQETNNVLMEQLSQLQAFLPNRSNRTKRSGTRILILLLSFSLLISSNLQPKLYSHQSRRGHTLATVASHSLHSLNDVPEASALPVPPASSRLEYLWIPTENR
ncbi:cyclic AMP-responsive element-binding protein 3-like protein 3-A [Brachionichthys hirsutus]|uniref:cyclic AMP-responsive element-binding protein 3-like protein 3-A n=1 Tax=Brachionichthys hirsutus TaxID=412623 RepID=UPI003604B11D